ncbi:MAG: DUF4126 domain-containing protein [Candidatus Poseidoniales archaeon]|jgi:hypothetical protein|uniref:DUF4126 domain-containing protein n=1 Tax=Marine Group III euryarchaeote CG-Epi1 TaxID=1888995 RepID=A0A1J5TWT2_9ARCH|nr:MAG: hypothetical protein BD935_03820 [Marine Group III euryarchaeote CG-Epi1]|tara:strand:- start:35 stop:616 length:582 start_codon:yes stop_codon:yes gene_type:complete
MDVVQILLSLSLGLGLAAACGFRVFIPPLMMGVGSRLDLYKLEGSFVWVDDTWAIAIFAVATLLEIGGYFIPWIDNLLDTVATPAAILGGIFVTSASLEGELDPSAQWTLSVIAGGSVSGVIQLGTVATRAISTGTTGGLANPIISLLEAVASILCILISLFLVAIIPIVIIFLIWKSIGYIQITKKEVVVQK